MYYADLFALWALERSGRRGTTRLYWGVRCSDMEIGRYGRMLRTAIAAGARRAARPDAVVANSLAGRAHHRRLGYAPRRFPVIPNGIDTHRFAPDGAARARLRRDLGLQDGEICVLHAARVDPMKDHPLLLEAAAALPALRFLAAGAGTDALRGPPNFSGLGIRADMPALYAAADLFLSTSAFGEGFANVIGEAMAAGCPVVATDVGDAARIVGETGAIAPPRDKPAVVAALARLAGEAAAARAGRAGAARARIEAEFSLARCVAAFDALHLRDEDPPCAA
jgi:glycosyltransferase involved in cell wall biosynthesis